ncbi:toll/interleukin-1 receptor domain-containing protein [Mucilaginibacter flavidus]|uniref:toll/interleukin-1 receptor domain-containing protein n=1 Tax=Mucilaginibacter flavidus TaxID=2949309 RepID=UPI0020921CD9|nr:toll/interleukin-1 receptor domain-containing protein [Mucilaginibacter flavidus]MCO5950872.1 toll/interleukin-1 receptor domain-containing protein [Mucilaginibacter flavidus]
MSILSKSQLASIAQSKAGSRGLRGVVNETRLFAKSTAITSVFLSHSHTDRDIVEQAKIFFENLGITVYVDWADKTMPEKTDGATAQKIKNQIISINDKFVLLATNNGIASKWCNWEVGIADPFKLPNKKMALLPLADNNGSWNGNEYLQIYPRIERGTTNSNEFWVWYPDNSLESLTSWLQK